MTPHGQDGIGAPLPQRLRAHTLQGALLLELPAGSSLYPVELEEEDPGASRLVVRWPRQAMAPVLKAAGCTERATELEQALGGAQHGEWGCDRWIALIDASCHKGVRQAGTGGGHSFHKRKRW